LNGLFVYAFLIQNQSLLGTVTSLFNNVTGNINLSIYLKRIGLISGHIKQVLSMIPRYVEKD